jgi:hypothetical protein
MTTTTRPVPPRRGNTVSAYLDAVTYAALLARSSDTGEPINAIVAAAVRDYLAKPVTVKS